MFRPNTGLTLQKLGYIFLICWAYFSVAMAQPSVERARWLTIADGLPGQSITNIAQDHLGYLWIGTTEGLGRYDGHRVQRYRHIPNQPESLLNNRITALAVDSLDLWVGTLRGVTRINVENGDFTHFVHDSANANSLGSNVVRDILRDSQGRLWFTTRIGLSLFRKKTQDFIRFYHQPDQPNSLGYHSLHEIHQDQQGIFWISSLKGLISMDYADPGNPRFDYFLHDPKDPNSLPSNITLGIASDNLGGIWIGTNLGLVRFDRDSRKFRQIYPQKPGKSLSVMGIHIDEQQNIWFGGREEGLFYVAQKEPPDGNFQPIPITRDYSFFVLFEDRKKFLWLGSLENGLLRIDRQPTRFRSFQPNPEATEVFASRISAMLVNQSGHLWCGTHRGDILIYDQDLTLIAKHFLPNIVGLRGQWLRMFAEDAKGNIWIGTLSGLLKWHRQTNKFHTKMVFEHFSQADADPAAPPTIADLFQSGFIDDNQQLWIGTWKGLILYHIPSDEFITFYNKPQPAERKFGLYTEMMLLDKDNHLWLHNKTYPLVRATVRDTLDKFRIPSSVRRYPLTVSPDSGLISAEIHAIYLDDQQGLWIASREGLQVLDRETDRFRIYNTENGLSHEAVTTIRQDKSGDFWIAGYGGLSSFRRQDIDDRHLRPRHFSEYDGLLSSTFISNATAMMPNGRLLFGGLSGVNTFFPDSLQWDPKPPQIAISGIHIGTDQSILINEWFATEPLALTHEDRNIRFDLAVLDYRDPTQHRYAYRLDGVDQDWVYTAEPRSTLYERLLPGEYLFRAIGANSEGIWSDREARVAIVIPPPFWQTWWFRVLIILLLMAIPVLIYRYRHNRQLALERLRVRIASDLHDDIGSTLNNISMKAELMRAGIDPQENQKNLAEISSISQDMIGRMSDVIWSIDARNDRLHSLFDRMKDAADMLLGQRGIMVNFIIAEFPLEKQLPVDVRQNIYLIFKEAIHNAAKYSRATEVTVDISNHRHFVMTISDNGKGASGRKRSGHGLRNMEMRAQALGGSLQVMSRDGYIVRLKCPQL